MFQACPGKREIPLVSKRFSLSGVCLYEREGVLDSLPEMEECARQSMNRLMVCLHMEEDIESHQRPHLFRGIGYFLAQCSRTPIRVLHFLGGIAADGH